MHAPRRLSPATLKGRRHKAFVGLDGRINYTRAVADDTISSKHCVRLQHEPHRHGVHGIIRPQARLMHEGG